MSGIAPKDVSEQFETGTSVTGAYQTSGVYQGAPSLGQADNYTVMNGPPLGDDGMRTLMHKLHDATETAMDGSTGVIANIAQTGQGAFDVTTGSRGDSPVFIVTVAADNSVSILKPQEKIPDADYHVTEFGSLGMAGADNVIIEKIALKPGERAFVVTASDGLTDAYLGPGKDMAADIAGYLKAHPGAQDISRYLAERATELGAEDNTTIIATALHSQTDLRGQSVTMAVFDGVGHEDGTLSNQLARTLENSLEGGAAPKLLAREELDHISARFDDYGRGAAAAIETKPAVAAAEARQSAPVAKAASNFQLKR
ncbi:MAG TPA: hypothetical protein VEF76_04150 [Patescibacteria group bacterium]|nr:hypothetical protein [Patescibacteria group bacterium]